MSDKKIPKPIAKLTDLIADSKAARKPSAPEFEFAIADSVELLNTSHWDELAKFGSIMMSRRYLSVLRSAGPQGLMQRAGIIYQSGQPVAAFCTQTLDVNASDLISKSDKLSAEDKLQLSLKKLKRKALKTVNRRLLICGNVLSWGTHGLAIRDGHQSDELWTAIAEAMYRLRRGDKLHGQTDYVIIKDLPASISDQATALSKFGYRAIETEPNMVLNVDPAWTTFDDYLGSLNKKYRKSAKKVVNAISSAGVTIEPLAQGEDVGSRIHELYHSVRARANVRVGEVGPEFFTRLSTELGEDFAIIVAKQGEDIVGFVTVIRDGSTAIGYYIGVDYEANGQLPVYHRLLFAVIEQSIRWGCKRVSFGRTALDAKARLGCVPEPLFVWIRHRVPVLNIFVRQLLRVVSHDEPPERNPFKAK